MDLQEYKEYYQELYNHEPGPKCIEAFLKLYPQPDPTPEEFWEDDIRPILPRFELRRVDIEIL